MAFIIGVFLGAFLGVSLMAILQVGKISDDDETREENDK